ncbi:MAG: hypothetical protein QM688_05150 [Sphingomonas bacterium]
MEAYPAGALLVIERPDVAGAPRVTLDGYGAELLSGYIMSARLAAPHALPDEQADGPYPTHFGLGLEPCAVLRLTQRPGAMPRREAIALEIPTPFWDRLYAELCLATAHMRELDRRAGARVH